MSATASVWNRLDRLLSKIRPYRQPVSLLVDGLVVAATWNVTYLFRLGFERWLRARPTYDGGVMLAVVATYLVVFLLAGIPRGMWRFSGFGEVRRLTLACLAAGLLCAVAVLMAQLAEVPRAVLALHPFITLIGLCMVRIGYRMVYEHARSRLSNSNGADVRRAIVMGAGEAAKRLLAMIHQQGWTVVGLLDDDPAKQGARIGSVSVLGRLADVADPQVRGDATHLIVALPGATAAQRRKAIALASATELQVLTVPSSSELQDGSARIEKVRSIEADDLLGREPVRLDERSLAGLITAKTVLVTGAGGSIGSELCRQVARYGPARIVLYELSEYALYQIEQQLGELHPHLPLVRLIGDVKQIEHLRATFAEQRPHLVLHAAAFKHVPLMEDDHNAWAALQNNLLGTWNCATAASEAGAERFVLISTDKAVNPTSVMGATKRAAEIAISHLATLGQAVAAGMSTVNTSTTPTTSTTLTKPTPTTAMTPAETPTPSSTRTPTPSPTTPTTTRFSAVRFGNVLGSSGSVIPKFKEQIARGGPVTVTHPDITRYFMTIPEAARLVLQAAALAESGQVYVLDMGESVRIVDLARDLIRLSGHREEEIGIVFSGLRPGEKLFEELLADADRTLASAHPRLRIARLNAGEGEQVVADLTSGFSALEPNATGSQVRSWLQRHVPEYRPG